MSRLTEKGEIFDWICNKVKQNCIQQLNFHAAFMPLPILLLHYLNQLVSVCLSDVSWALPRHGIHVKHLLTYVKVMVSILLFNLFREKWTKRGSAGLITTEVVRVFFNKLIWYLKNPCNIFKLARSLCNERCSLSDCLITVLLRCSKMQIKSLSPCMNSVLLQPLHPSDSVRFILLWRVATGQTKCQDFQYDS